MAGQRRAEYVSIPLGPGVYSNTTGRGAKTRSQSGTAMLWDRWKNADWVRWHKQKAEKQGGWAYQQLTAPDSNQVQLPGNPVLLLHLDAIESGVNAVLLLHFEPTPFTAPAGLMLHFDGANGATATVDSSVNAFTMTDVGGANLSTTTPKFGTACGNFVSKGGTGWTAPLTTGGPLDLLTGPWTVECWVRTSDTSPSHIWSGQGVAFTGTYYRGFTSGSVATLQPLDLGGATVQGPNTINVTDGNWHHVVFTVDEFQRGAVATDGVWGSPANGFSGGTNISPAFCVGFDTSDGVQNQAFLGQLDDFRVTKGVAVYSIGVPFTPPAAPLTDTASGVDYYQTVDSSPSNATVAINYPFALLWPVAPKFGVASLAMNGGNNFNTYVCSVPIAANGPLDIFTQASWTIECFWKVTTDIPTNTFYIVDYGNNDTTPSTTDFILGVTSTGGGSFSVGVGDGGMFGGSLSILETITTAAGVWHHIAVVNNQGTTTLYIDGVAAPGTVTSWIPANYNNTNAHRFVNFGQPTRVSGTWMPGEVDEFRVTPIAVYTANFTPSTVPLSATVGAIASLNTADSSSYAWPMTTNGVLGVTTTNQEFGTGAMTVTGSSASLSTPLGSASPLDVSTTDFTLEMWLYSTQEALTTFFDASDGGTTGFFLQQLASGNVAANIWNGSAYVQITAPITLDTWTDVCLVRQGNVFTLYTQGEPAGTTTIAGSIGPMGGNMGVGGGHLTSVLGDIDEVRLTRIAVYDSAYTPPTAPGLFGLPNTTGSAIPPVAEEPSTYVGVCRALHDWASIDGQYWIALGTNLKLYVVNQATLYDITPDRKTSNVSGAIATTSGSNEVTITDVEHQANTGDFIDISGAQAVGGLTLGGDYQISVIDPDTYTIYASTPATSTATGGGSFSIAYEIQSGLPQNGELLGYGTGTYGALTYGTPRAAGTGVFARMRTWSLDNYGQDLIASQSDGEIYWWQKNQGPSSPAALLTNAPQGCQRVIVDAQQRVIIALGCTDVTSAYDAMLVRWCSFDDITDWYPTDVNTAGDDLLTSGSRIVTGIKTKGQNLIWTDTTLYRMVFVGGADIYDFYPSGQVAIVGPNAAVDVNGVAYWWGFDNFYNYSGTMQVQECEVWETVLDPNFPTSLNRAQSESVVCFTFEPKTEITWLYPSIGGQVTVTFTAGIAQGALEATLASAWQGATGIYTLAFSDQESQFVTLTQGQTTATWDLPLTGPVSATAVTIGNDRYVTFNWEDQTWYFGAWVRTCAQGRAPAMGGLPYGVNAGYLYQHEVGTDAVEPYGTVAKSWFMESLDITVGGAKSEYTMGGSDARFAIGGSDAHLLLRAMIPDWQRMTGEMNLTVWTKDRPQQQTYVQEGPIEFDVTTVEIDIDAHGSQLVIRFDNLTQEDGSASLGSSFRMGTLQGLSIPYAKR